MLNRTRLQDQTHRQTHTDRDTRCQPVPQEEPSPEHCESLVELLAEPEDAASQRVQRMVGADGGAQDHPARCRVRTRTRTRTGRRSQSRSRTAARGAGWLRRRRCGGTSAPAFEWLLEKWFSPYGCSSKASAPRHSSGGHPPQIRQQSRAMSRPPRSRSWAASKPDIRHRRLGVTVTRACEATHCPARHGRGMLKRAQTERGHRQ